MADIEIKLRGEADRYGTPAFAPGETLSGILSIFPDKDVDCKHLYVRLVWQTEGRGTRYREEVTEQDIYQGTLRGGFPNTHEFQLPLPLEPWSYAGHYVSIVWRVEVQIDVAWARDPNESAVFILRPGLEEIVADGYAAY